jgi:hypothetical protein
MMELRDFADRSNNARSARRELTRRNREKVMLAGLRLERAFRAVSIATYSKRIKGEWNKSGLTDLGSAAKCFPRVHGRPRIAWPDIFDSPPSRWVGRILPWVHSMGAWPPASVKPKRLTATARKIAVLFYNAMRFGMAYQDPGADQYERS